MAVVAIAGAPGCGRLHPLAHPHRRAAGLHHQPVCAAAKHGQVSRVGGRRRRWSEAPAVGSATTAQLRGQLWRRGGGQSGLPDLRGAAWRRLGGGGGHPSPVFSCARAFHGCILSVSYFPGKVFEKPGRKTAGAQRGAIVAGCWLVGVEASPPAAVLLARLCGPQHTAMACM